METQFDDVYLSDEETPRQPKFCRSNTPKTQEVLDVEPSNLLQYHSQLSAEQPPGSLPTPLHGGIQETDDELDDEECRIIASRLKKTRVPRVRRKLYFNWDTGKATCVGGLTVPLPRGRSYYRKKQKASEAAGVTKNTKTGTTNDIQPKVRRIAAQETDAEGKTNGAAASSSTEIKE